MSLFFLFLDGVGLGTEGEHNPLVDARWDAFDRLTGEKGLKSNTNSFREENQIFIDVDANLDIEGLPQSGTGQASLFSGENASKIIGRHFGPYPHSRIRFLLEEKSLFHQVQTLKLEPFFLNAYPEIFFKKMKRRNRWTCTTLMAASAGQRLNRTEDLRYGRALTAEIVQDAWREKLGIDVKSIYPEEAAERVLVMLEEYDLLLYEYYLTDKAGHSRSVERSFQVLEVLNRFLRHIMNGLADDDYLVLCSDHGNLEDLRVKTHTRNRVPLIVFGNGSGGKAEQAESIMDLPNVIRSLLKEGKAGQET